MINALLNLIADHGSGFIIASGVIVFVLLIINGVVLSNSKSRIKENLNLDLSEYSINLKEEKLERASNQNDVLAPKVIRDYEKKFNEACTYHDIISQLIPIFPLLGILGTVAGLMIIAPAGGNAEADALKGLYNGMGTALGTTLYGLIVSIILKFIDAVFSSRIINDVDVMIEDFNNKLELVNLFKQS